MSKIMSNVCCKEFRGWFKSFTKIERVLAILEAILLVVFVVLLILLILHLIACAQPKDKTGSTSHGTPALTSEGKHNTTIDGPSTKRDLKPGRDTGSVQMAGNKTTTRSQHVQTTSSKICSWTPSIKTTAASHYYANTQFSVSKKVSFKHTPNEKSYNITASNTSPLDAFEPESEATSSGYGYVEEFVASDQSDGEEAGIEHKSHIVALVKLKPPRDVIFGCILTIVSDHWTLTAASCIEAIEEVDSLDSFVIMEQYGIHNKGPLWHIQDIQIHPLYEGRNKSYDLAALKSADSLVKRSGSAVELATVLDYTLSTIGERFTILGYGPLRSLDKRLAGRGLRRAAVHRVGARACAGAEAEAEAEAWALRHLLPGRAAAAARCWPAPLCCGALSARGLPCRYCAGTPLLRGARLYGVMAANRRCGLSCEPQLYVNVADVADWIRSLVRQQ